MAETGSTNQVVKVKRDKIAACMTCPLCNNLLNEATAITECLHTFCRKCIYGKIQDEDIECCPVCNIDLGSLPLEKLRPDHSLQAVRAKIFPVKSSKAKEQETTEAEAVASESVTSEPAKRKERSLSSLVISAPRVSPTQASMTRRRSRKAASSAIKSSNTSNDKEKTVGKDEDCEEDPEDRESSPETLYKMSQNVRQSSSTAQCGRAVSSKQKENGTDEQCEETDLWKLNFLVDVVNGTTDSSEPANVPANETQVPKTKNKEEKSKSKADNKNNTTDPSNSKKSRRARHRASAGNEGSSIPPQAIIDAAAAINYARRRGLIWLSLVAADVQLVDPKKKNEIIYLQIKDEKMPVSAIQKYLKQKLKQPSEIEIEIRCMGQPLIPSLQVGNLLELWLQTGAPTGHVTVTVGSSAKEFVMPLTFARKPEHHP